MKKDYLKELNDLISVMTSSEKLLVSKQLNVGYSNLKANDKKMIQLFKSVKSGKQYNYDKLKQKVSPKSNKDSFNRLIRRLTYRLEESLILEQNINRKGAYSEIFRIRHRLKKQIIQAQILAGRGMVLKSMNICRRVKRDALKFELFNELIEATIILYQLSFSRKDSKYSEDLKTELEQFYLRRNSLEGIKDIVNEYDMLSSAISFRESDAIELLEKCINQVSEKIKIAETANGIAYLFLLKLEYYDYLKDYSSYISEGQNLIELIENESSVYSLNRIIFLNNKISKYNIYLFRFEKAINLAKKAISYFDTAFNINYLNAIENLVISYIYLAEYEESIILLDNLLNQEFTTKYPGFRSKFFYYHSVCYFLTNDIKNASLSLNQTTEIEKDKEGWNIWIRLLRLMILIEQKKYDLLEYEIESFRKYIQRTESNDTERINLILSLLIELERREFEFKVASRNKVKDLERLQNDPLVQWNINSPELIQFHNWFYSKIEDAGYKPIF